MVSSSRSGFATDEAALDHDRHGSSELEALGTFAKAKSVPKMADLINFDDDDDDSDNEATSSMSTSELASMSFFGSAKKTRSVVSDPDKPTVLMETDGASSLSISLQDLPVLGPSSTEGTREKQAAEDWGQTTSLSKTIDSSSQSPQGQQARLEDQSSGITRSSSGGWADFSNPGSSRVLSPTVGTPPAGALGQHTSPQLVGSPMGTLVGSPTGHMATSNQSEMNTGPPQMGKPVWSGTTSVPSSGLPLPNGYRTSWESEYASPGRNVSWQSASTSHLSAEWRSMRWVNRPSTTSLARPTARKSTEWSDALDHGRSPRDVLRVRSEQLIEEMVENSLKSLEQMSLAGVRKPLVGMGPFGATAMRPGPPPNPP